MFVSARATSFSYNFFLLSLFVEFRRTDFEFEGMAFFQCNLQNDILEDNVMDREWVLYSFKSRASLHFWNMDLGKP